MKIDKDIAIVQSLIDHAGTEEAKKKFIQVLKSLNSYKKHLLRINKCVGRWRKKNPDKVLVYAKKQYANSDREEASRKAKIYYKEYYKQVLIERGKLKS